MTPYYLTEEIAHRVKGRLIGSASLPISGIKSLRMASKSDIALYLPAFGETLLNQTQAGCVMLDDESLAAKHSLPCVIIVKSPWVAIELVDKLLAQTNIPHVSPSCVAKTAIVHPQAMLGRDVCVGERTWLDADVHLDDHVVIGSGVNIGSGASIGRNTLIGDNVTIAPNCAIAANVIIGDGCVIGARPYQYLKTKGVWQGSMANAAVILKADVAVGANTVIEQGVLADTLISEGVKIAHDVVIGSHSAIISHAALGAKAVIGEHCIIGGGCLIASQITIANDVVLTGGGIVSRSIAKPGIYSSAVNVKPHHRWRKNLARLHQLDSIVKRFRRLENKIKEREKTRGTT